MVNERLRRAMLRAGHGPDSLAAALQVSSKSVARWLAGTSVPYPKTRYRIAALVGEDESYLWPEVADRRTLAGAELVATWPRRTDVPKHLWTDLLRQAERSVDVLAFAGLFLPEEHPEWLPTLRAKAEADVRVRLVLGDPDGRQLPARDEEKAIGGGVAGRVAAVLAHYRPLADVAQIRLHDTPLYNSIYRFDDELLVNLHVYGLLAAYTPCLHIRRIDGQFSTPTLNPSSASGHRHARSTGSGQGDAHEPQETQGRLLAGPGGAQADQPQGIGLGSGP